MKKVLPFILITLVLFPEQVFAVQSDLRDVYYFGFLKSFSEGLQKLIQPGFTVAGIAVLFYFLIAAFKLTTSQGDKEAIQSAQKMITHSVIGIFLLIAAFLLLQWIPLVFDLQRFVIIRR